VNVRKVATLTSAHALDALVDLIADRVAERLSERIPTKPTRPEALPAEYLGQAEVARRLGISPRTLETWRYKGTGPPATRIGCRHIRYQASALAAWAASKRQQ